MIRYGPASGTGHGFFQENYRFWRFVN